MSSATPRRGRRRKIVGFASVVSLSFVAVACGDDDEETTAETQAPVATSAPADETTAPVSTDADDPTPTEAPASTPGGSTAPEATDAAAPTKTDTLHIGSVFSLSGAVAPFTEGSVHAVNLAVQQINDAGGFVVGDTTYTIELTMLDDRSDPAVATASATELVEDEGVNIILGPTTSVTSPAVAEYVVPQGILMFSPASSLFPMLTPELVAEDNKTLFNTSADPTAEVGFHARAIELWYPDAQRVALIYDDGGIGRANGPLFKSAVEQLGLEVVAEEVYPAAATDYSTFLTTIKGAEPDLLFVCCNSNTNSLLVKQSIELDVAPAFISKGGSLRPPTSDAVGGPIEQPYASTITPGEMEILADGTLIAPRPGYQKYLDDLKSVLGEDPSVNENGALYFYDYVFMLVEAMKVAGTVDDPIAIAEALENLEFEGPTLGPITYSDAHFPQVPADTCLVTNGEVECEILPFEG